MAEPATRLTLPETLDILASTPGRIAEATAGVDAGALLEPLEADGWSARDILGHLRACHQTWAGYVTRILDEDEPSFRAENPRTTIHRTDFLSIAFRDSLAGFTSDRDPFVARLQSTSDEDLARVANVRIPGMGLQTRSAFHYVHRMAEHERQHVRHIEQMLASERGGADG